MSVASSTIELIKNLDVADAVSGGISAFLGAFFAFCFFIISKWIERKHEWKKTCKNEHSYLERYFHELKYSIEFNKKLLEEIISSYKNNKIVLNKLSDLPLRNDVSMKINDLLFINKLETYINNGIKRINLVQFGISEAQNRINNDIIDNDPIKIKRAEKSLGEFISESENILKMYDYYLDVIFDLMIENRVILKKNKNWKYNQEKMDKIFSERRKKIEYEKQLTKKNYFNPLVQEQKEKLKKHGLNDE